VDDSFNTLIALSPFFFPELSISYMESGVGMYREAGGRGGRCGKRISWILGRE